MNETKAPAAEPLPPGTSRENTTSGRTIGRSHLLDIPPAPIRRDPTCSTR